MPIIKEGNGWRFQIVHRIPDRKRPGKTIPKRVSKLFERREEALQFELDYRSKIAGGSLTAPYYSDLVEHYLSEKGTGGISARCFSRSVDDLGGVRCGKQFDEHYHSYCRKLQAEGLKDNTVNNYRTAIRSVLNYAYKTGKLDQVPVRFFAMGAAVERDRVFMHDERQRLENAMLLRGSWLYWPVYFAERNPIREGDLFNLRRENYDMAQNVIRFVPQKTAKRRNRETWLVEIDERLTEYFRSKTGEYLFTRNDGNQVKKYAHEWAAVCKIAGLVDFHLHDLRHVATTNMLEARDADGQRLYDEDDFRSLGIFYSKRIVELYRNRRAERVLNRVRSSQNVVFRSGTNG